MPKENKHQNRWIEIQHNPNAIPLWADEKFSKNKVDAQRFTSMFGSWSESCTDKSSGSGHSRLLTFGLYTIKFHTPGSQKSEWDWLVSLQENDYKSKGAFAPTFHFRLYRTCSPSLWVKQKKGRAKESGEHVRIYADSPKDVRELTKYLDNEKKEYYVIPDRAERPTKVVIPPPLTQKG
ncbi:hypothetical protein AVEN_16380-1 [Araneus ventricosus]|uniref:Uncharacterized protein n=1 Tax=Araneus ventricosus TaxID=182803 RepID=A0A4Y2WEH6_ARAVE|nr:hypothetical protein AVEN_16380-1 [Araneus ventricosus]